jgi:glycosyltransferase involved in cell wall biosynthesis
MAALDVLAVPSTSPEPFGRTILEAMASGTPVIATAHGGPLDIIEDGETGLLVPPGDPAALAVAIIQMAEEPGWRERMGEAGRAEVVEKYTTDKYVDRVLEVYGEVMGGAAG